METGPFEDVFPLANWDIPASYVSLPEGNLSTEDLYFPILEAIPFG